MEGGDELPTYANLQEQEGGSARWNRWRGWIEKRAAERYADGETQRKPTGWGPSYDDDPEAEPNEDVRPQPLRQLTRLASLPPEYSTALPPPPTGERLDPCHIALHHFGSRFLPHSIDPITSVLHLPSLNFVLIGTRSGLSVLDPLPSLHGETSTTSTNPPLSDAVAIPIWKGEAVYQLTLLEQATQDAFSSPSSTATPQGVVLALVGKEDDESSRCVRMYNLSSLTSLVRWAISQKVNEPIELARMDPTNLPTGGVLKKQRPHTLTKPIRQLFVDPAQSLHGHHSSSSSSQNRVPTIQPYRLAPSTSNTSIPDGRRPHPKDTPSHHATLSATPSTAPPYAASAPSAQSHESLDSAADSTWDFVDELPIRWAQDYVPLATANSRLTNVSVNFFEVYRGLEGKGSTYLAIATRTNILLYEAPKGERVFKYVKEFYTPFITKSITFVNQRDSSFSRSSSSSPHVQTLGRSGSHGRETGSRHGHSHSRSSKSVDYGVQLCLFVTFDKKAGLIRVGDAAVTEVESFPDIGISATRAASHSSEPTSPGSGSFRRSLADAASFWKSTPPWLPLTKLKIPPMVYSSLSLAISNYNSSSGSRSTDRKSDGFRLRTLDEICFLTRGRTTQILPVPLPVSFGALQGSSSSTAPLKTLTWAHQHTRIRARVVFDSPPRTSAPANTRPSNASLQLIGFGEDGVEVVEISFAFLIVMAGSKSATSSPIKGKSKNVLNPLMDDRCLRAFGDLGGCQAGYLCEGGEWEATLNEQYLSKLYPNGRPLPPLPGRSDNSLPSSPTSVLSSTSKFTVIGADYLPAIVSSPTQEISIAGTLSNLTIASSNTYGSADEPSPAKSAVTPVERRARRVSGLSGMGLGLEKGIYGWCARGVEDYRVFWLGGGLVGEVDDYAENGGKSDGKML